MFLLIFSQKKFSFMNWERVPSTNSGLNFSLEMLKFVLTVERDRNVFKICVLVLSINENNLHKIHYYYNNTTPFITSLNSSNVLEGNGLKSSLKYEINKTK